MAVAAAEEEEEEVVVVVAAAVEVVVAAAVAVLQPQVQVSEAPSPEKLSSRNLPSVEET